jgi:hypothetical protein
MADLRSYRELRVYQAAMDAAMKLQNWMNPTTEFSANSSNDPRSRSVDHSLTN